MVIQRAVNHLRERPKDEKKVVAGGIAILVIVVLFFVWSILFLKKIQNGNQSFERNTTTQGEDISTSVREAQEDLQNMFTNFGELEAAREQGTSQQSQDQDTPPTPSDGY